MKTAIIAAMLVISGALFAGQQEPDMKFVALALWGSELETKANVWNDHCKDSVESLQCVQTAALLNQLQVFYIEAAMRYTKVESDSFSELKFRTIQHQVHTFIWNVNCGGKMLSKDEFTQCKEQSDKNDTEKAALQKEIDAWQAKQGDKNL